MKKKSAEDYLDKLLNSVNDEKVKKEKFKETAKILEDAIQFWEDADDEDFEEASYMEIPVKEEKKSGQEDFLDSLLNGAKNTEFGMNKKKPNPNPMYSRRVSKSEADFLREFEEELAGDSDDFADLFGQFDEEIKPEDRLETEDIPVQKDEADSFTLGGVDLAALVSETADDTSEYAPVDTSEYAPVDVPEDVPMDNPADILMDELSMMDMLPDNPIPEPEEIPMDTISMEEIPGDVFQDLFGGEDGLDMGEAAPAEPASDGIDLGNLGEEDLMNLLAGADGLSDIGDMLSQNEDAAEVPLDGLDAFAAFAEGEMAVQQISADPVEEEEVAPVGKKAKKGGLIGKLKSILGNLMKDDEEDEVTIKPASAPTAEELSGENADILAELDSLEEKPGKKKKEKKKKEKKKKEKKPKKEKAPKKPKEPKPKKEKKPKEVDNTPPLPRGPVIMIWLMVASLFALVLLGVNTIGYSSSISSAKELKNQGHYAEAFSKLDGLKIKEKDLELYDQLAILATADSELNAYQAFASKEMVVEAFDSLVCAAGRCELNEESADVYGCLGQLEILKKTVSNELNEKYGTTYEEAIEMYSNRDRDDYTIALYQKLISLGYELD